MALTRAQFIGRTRQQQQQRIQQQRIAQSRQRQIDSRRREIERIVRGLETSKDKKFTSSRGRARRLAQLQGLQKEIEVISKGGTLQQAQIESFKIRSKARKKLRITSVSNLEGEKPLSKRQKALAKLNKKKPLQKFKRVPKIKINVDDFLEKNSKKYVSLSGNKRKKFFLELEQKYGNNVANTVVSSANALNQGALSDEDIKAITDKLFTKDGRPRQNIAVDNETISLILKQDINKRLISEGEKPLRKTSRLSTFLKVEKDLEKKIKNRETVLGRKILEGVTLKGNFEGKNINQLKSNDKRIIVNKFNTGQSVTPNEKILFAQITAQSNKKLTTAQVKNLKQVYQLPTNYVKNLKVRVKNGEKNPLFNDTLNFSIGLGKGLKDVFVDPVVGYVNYWSKVVDRAFKQDKRTYQVIVSDVKKVSKGVVNVSKFVKDNPLASGLIVATAVRGGADVTAKEYALRPAETLGRAVAWFFPNKILKIAGKPLKLQKGLDSLGKAKKWQKNKFKVNQDFNTGKIKAEGDIFGELLLGGKFETKYKMVFNPKTKTWSGKVTTLRGKKKVSQSIKIKDEGAFFKDLGTSEKFVKSKLPISNKRIDLKQTTISNPKRKGATIIGDAIAFDNVADVKVVFTSILNNITKTTTRTSQLIQRVDANTSKVIKNFSKQLSKVTTSKRRRFNKIKINPNDEKALENFLKSIDYDKTILNGLDKRTRIARALGLRKESNVIDSIVKSVTSKGELKPIIKAQATFSGEVIEGVIPKIKRFKFTLSRNKKGSLSVLENSKVETYSLSKSTNKLNKDFVQIPKINTPIPLTTTNLKVLGIVNLFKQMSKTGQLIKQSQQMVQKSKQTQELKKLNDRVNKFKTVIKQINKKIQTKKTIKTPKTKTIVKTVTKAKTPVIKTRTPIKPTGRTPRTPKPLKKIKFNLKSKPPKGKRLSYDVFYKSKGKVKSLGLKVPQNKALSRAVNLIDNTTKRSMEVRPVGFTKAKDITKPSLRKFALRKTTTALKLVEKPKNLIDTRGEKKGLTLAKRLKRKR